MDEEAVSGVKKKIKRTKEDSSSHAVYERRSNGEKNKEVGQSECFEQ